MFTKIIENKSSEFEKNRLREFESNYFESSLPQMNQIQGILR